MSEPVVNLIVAPRQPGLAVLSVLKDWSALGLVSDFFWVTAEAADPRAQRLPTSVISAGSATTVDLQGELARMGGLAQARICVLDPLTGSAPTAVGAYASASISAAAPGVPQRLVHCVVTALGAGGTRRPTIAQGWHGVVVAPQDSQTPLAARRQVRASDDAHSLAMHHASGVAGVVGLWDGFPVTPLDALRPGPADQLRLSQAFLQIRDASAFGASLRTSLTHVHPELPRPVANGRLLPRSQDARGAGAAAAEALFSIHGWLLHHERQPMPAGSAQQIGPRQALVMFFSFLWGALRVAPQHWWERLVSRGSRKLAAVTQRTVFGDDSQYDVVVRGWLPSGQLATPAQVNEAAGHILRRLDPGARHEEAASTFPQFWRDFCGVALDLADGGQRVPDAQAPRFGGQPAVVASPAAIAPGPGETFTGIPPHLASALGVSEISPSDLRTTELVSQRLDVIMQQRGGPALEANTARSAIADWSRRTQHASYAGQVGGRLNAAQGGLRKEIDDNRASLAQLTSQAAPDDGFAEDQRRLSRRARWLLWLGVVAVGILLLAWNRAWVQPGTALRWVIVVVLLELVVQLYLFLRGQQALFQLLNRQRQLEDDASVCVHNLTACLTDLQRVDAAYQQFVPVAEALGSFVAQPLGVPQPAPRSIDLPAEPLPHCLKIGTVSAERAAVAPVADELRTRLFPVGWMEEPYRLFLASAAGMLGPAGDEFAHDPGRLFSDPAAGPDAPLRRWTAALRRSGTPAALGDATWSRAVQLLTDQEFLAAAGIGGLATHWAGGEPPVRGLAGGLDPDSAASAQFDTEILAPAARSGPGRLVDPAAVLTQRRNDGMGTRHLLVMLGQPFDATEITAAVREPAAAASPAPPGGGPRI